MAAVIKVANVINKQKESKDEVLSYIQSLGDDWKQFIDGEFKRSNEINNRSLGGQQPRSSMGDEDGGDNDYEMNMDKIMAKFSNFNAMSASKASNDDDDDDEDKIEEDRHDDDLKNDLLMERDREYESDKPSSLQIHVELKVQEPLVQEFVDTSYWKVDLFDPNNVDALLEDYE